MDSNSALMYPTTNCESLRINRLLAPTRGRVQLRLSWLRILTRCWRRRSLNELPVQSFPRLGRLIVDLCRLLIVWKPHQRKGSTSPFHQGKCRAVGFMQGNQLRLAPSLKASACTGFHTRLVPLRNMPSFRTYQVCESCPGMEG